MSKKKWHVTATVIGGKYIGTVEAETKEEAEAAAWDHDECYVSMCHHCSRQISDPEVTEIHVEQDE